VQQADFLRIDGAKKGEIGQFGTALGQNARMEFF